MPRQRALILERLLELIGLQDLYYDHYYLFIGLIVSVCMVIFLIPFSLAWRRADKELEEERKAKEREAATKGKSRNASTSEDSNGGKTSKSRSNKGVKIAALKKASLPSHPHVAAEFKGHTGAIIGLDFDVNGKYLASCSNDRTIRLWQMKGLADKEHKYIRKNIELDHASHLRFSPDGTAVVTCLSVAQIIAVYRITKLKAGSFALSDTEVSFPKCPYEVLALDMATTGKFIMTYGDQHFTVWSLKGDTLATTATNQAPNTCAVISPCGKFIATAGFTSDVKLWEVVFTKSGEFSQVTRAMDLTGHRASVLSISFSSDATRVATVSKDGSWKYWDVDVRYQLNESPKLLQTVNLPDKGGDPLVALSPDARLCAVSISTSIYLYLTETGELVETLSDVHRDTISALRWDPSSRYLASAGGEDRHVRLWHNIPGLKAMVTDLETKISKASTDSFKKRLEDQLAEIKQQLRAAGE